MSLPRRCEKNEGLIITLAHFRSPTQALLNTTSRTPAIFNGVTEIPVERSYAKIEDGGRTLLNMQCNAKKNQTLYCTAYYMQLIRRPKPVRLIHFLSRMPGLHKLHSHHTVQQMSKMQLLPHYSVSLVLFFHSNVRSNPLSLCRDHSAHNAPRHPSTGNSPQNLSSWALHGLTSTPGQSRNMNF